MLSFLSLITYNNLRDMSQRNADVTHTYRVRFKNKDLIKTLIDVETGQRGYLLTEDDIFLEPYLQGKTKIGLIQSELRVLLNDNNQQSKRLNKLDELIARKLIIMENGIKNLKKNRTIDTLNLYLGKIYMDKIRSFSEQIDDEEILLLKYRNDLQQSADTSITYYLFGLSGVSLAFLLVFFRLLYLELKRRIGFQNTLENKLAELERTNAELEQFAHITSHDLQEPLRKIRAFSERLNAKQGDQLSEDAKANIKKINQSASRMQQLINDLLAFSRVTNIKDYKHDDINLNEIIKESLEDFSEYISQKDATIITDKLPIIKGVRVQFVQLFNNLLSNSLKYSRQEIRPLIKIQYKQVSGSEIPNAGILQKENLYHRLTFIDNGIGFEEQYSEKIFTIFQRLHNKNEYEGTGIGLALCRRIVTNHNGYILTEVKKGHIGAIFHIYLPS
ncbi:Adaptive-response sensory-kinase SasA [Emticicia aquatica]|uniref:histidine kinase n=2 Tax=Emticicia aquatica TaxID=1681835 RepID=A0ABN8EY95_9BACT|nr:Adaptive-response sensory-kinase SasA [Emticicia aquatica]